MPYDPVLAQRLRERLSSTSRVTERKMFGGLCFLINGNLACGAQSQGHLFVRCAAEDFDAHLAEPGAGPMLRGQTRMTGWVLVDADCVKADDALFHWVDRAKSFAQRLPPKV